MSSACWIATTGPNTSSCTIGSAGSSASITVGSMYAPPGTGSAPHGALDAAEDAREMLRAHHRAQLRVRLRRVSRDEPTRKLDQPLGQWRRERTLHDHPGPGVARLPGVVEDAPPDRLGGRVE